MMISIMLADSGGHLHLAFYVRRCCPRRLLLLPRRQDELAVGLVLRPHHDALAVLLPLDHHRRDETLAVLDVVVLVEDELSARGRHVGLLEFLDDSVDLRR